MLLFGIQGHAFALGACYRHALRRILFRKLFSLVGVDAVNFHTGKEIVRIALEDIDMFSGIHRGNGHAVRLNGRRNVSVPVLRQRPLFRHFVRCAACALHCYLVQDYTGHRILHAAVFNRSRAGSCRRQRGIGFVNRNTERFRRAGNRSRRIAADQCHRLAPGVSGYRSKRKAL